MHRKYHHNKHLGIATNAPGVGSDDVENVVAVFSTVVNAVVAVVVDVVVDVVAVVVADDAVDAAIDVNAVVAAVAASMPSGAAAFLREGTGHHGNRSKPNIAVEEEDQKEWVEGGERLAATSGEKLMKTN